MRRMNGLIRWAHPETAAAICLIAGWAAYAGEAGHEKPAATQAVKAVEPAPAVAPAQPAPKPITVALATEQVSRPTSSDPLEQELERETATLVKMEAELKTVESLPLPSAAAPAVKVPTVKPAPSLDEIPKEPVKGLEEEYANALYSLGKYDLARAVYQRILESKPPEDVMAWARLQFAHCARRSGDLQAAGAAYEALLNAAPNSPWAAEAAWWAGEVKWWILWDQSTK